MKTFIKGFKGFSKINEQEEEDRPFRLYGEGDTPEAELIAMLKDLIVMINKANPTDQENYDEIKDSIRDTTSSIKRHRSFGELKDGIPWQDGFIKLSDWSSELKEAVLNMNRKATKKGLA
jgi:hypothetical protein